MPTHRRPPRLAAGSQLLRCECACHRRLVAAARPGDLAVTILDQPLIALGQRSPPICPMQLRREWLVTNGLGGYASGTVAGVNTRRYHGLLVAALAPPVERTVLVAGSVEWATYAGRALSTVHTRVRRRHG